MKVFVTGASGFLGSNIVRELLTQKYAVKAMVEKGKPFATIKDLPIDIVEGNILDEEEMNEHLSGCDFAIHTAASTAVYPFRSKKQCNINIEGTRNVLDACVNASVKRLVYVGTANSFGPGTWERPGNEKSPYQGDKYGLDYMDSKYESHLLVIRYVAEEKLDAVIVNPTFMLGPYDSGPSSGKMIIAVSKGKLPGYAPGSKNYIYVKDAAHAVVAALTKGRSGESYILGHENLSFKDAFGLMAEVAGVKPPGMAMPAGVVKAYGRFGSFLSWLTGKGADVTYPLARISCDHFIYSAQKAVTELGMPQTPIREAVADAMNWFRENGYLPKQL